MTLPDGEQYPTGGRYLEVAEPDRLRCTWGDPGDDDAPELTIELADAGEGRTAMIVRIDGVEPRPGDGDSVHDGWQQAFDALDDVLPQGVAAAGKDADVRPGPRAAAGWAVRRRGGAIVTGARAEPTGASYTWDVFSTIDGYGSYASGPDAID